MEINACLSIINLNVIGLNAPTKRTQGDGMDKKKKKRHIYMLLPTEAHFRRKDTRRLKEVGWRNIYYGNGGEKKAGQQYFYQKKLTLKQRL